MNCRKCNSNYGNDSHTPLLLPKCGHSLCRGCATTLFTAKSVKCPECEATSPIESVAQLPENKALLSMLESASRRAGVASEGTQQRSEEVKGDCPLHQKKVEAYCEEDRTLLCISCILLGGHKTHAIVQLEDAGSKERTRLEKGLATATQIEGKLRMLLSDVASARQQLNENANAKRDKIAAVYREIVDVIHQRESALKRSISNFVEKEDEALVRKATQLTQQLRLVTCLIADFSTSLQESTWAILQKSQSRYLQATEALKPPLSSSPPSVFPDIKKESELAELWKILVPGGKKASTATIHALTTSSANKRVERRPKGPTKAQTQTQMPTQTQMQTQERPGGQGPVSKDRKKAAIPPGGWEQPFVLERVISPKGERSNKAGLPGFGNKGSPQKSSANTSRSGNTGTTPTKTEQRNMIPFDESNIIDSPALSLEPPVSESADPPPLPSASLPPAASIASGNLGRLAESCCQAASEADKPPAST